jgi:hypothetical protein
MRCGRTWCTVSYSQCGPKSASYRSAGFNLHNPTLSFPRFTVAARAFCKLVISRWLSDSFLSGTSA